MWNSVYKQKFLFSYQLLNRLAELFSELLRNQWTTWSELTTTCFSLSLFWFSFYLLTMEELVFGGFPFRKEPFYLLVLTWSLLFPMHCFKSFPHFHSRQHICALCNLLHSPNQRRNVAVLFVILSYVFFSSHLVFLN